MLHDDAPAASTNVRTIAPTHVGLGNTISHHKTWTGPGGDNLATRETGNRLSTAPRLAYGANDSHISRAPTTCESPMSATRASLIILACTLTPAIARAQ